MDIFQSFAFNTAFYFMFKLLFCVITLGLVIFTFLVSRQVQLMNRVLHTSFSALFSIVGLGITLAALGVLIMSGISLFAM